MLKEKSYLSVERSYTAVKETNGQTRWVGVGYENSGQVVDAKSVKWSDNYDLF